jgi:hypothetical protein
MTGSLFGRALLLSLALSLLVSSEALAADPATTSETETTATEATTAETAQALEIAAGLHPFAETAQTRRLHARAVRFRAIARRWRALMAKPRPHLRRPAPEFDSLLAKRRWMARRWFAKAGRIRRAGHRPPHLSAWLCIHRWEGSWRDPNAPYYGGLQMDITFQRMYGRRLVRRKGTADHWRPLEQMWVAERALRAGRGFYPWPVAAGRCGLI